MRFLRRMFSSRPYRVVASGRLTVGSYRWAAVPGRMAMAFADTHRGALNALSFAHMTRELAARHPETAAFVARAAAQVRAIEQKYPGCVIFVDAGYPTD